MPVAMLSAGVSGPILVNRFRAIMGMQRTRFKWVPLIIATMGPTVLAGGRYLSTVSEQSWEC